METMLTKNERKLFSAIRNGNIEAAQQALKGNVIYKSADVNAHEIDGNTPLLTAISCENEKMVDLLLNAGANPLFGDGKMLPIGESVCRGNKKIFERLLDAGADTNVTFFPEKWPLIHYIVKARKPELLDVLLKRGYSADIKNADGMTALGIAVSAGIMKLVRVFADNHADFNVSQRTNENTLIHEAIQTSDMRLNNSEKKEMIQFLMEQGVDINQPNKYGRTPLMEAAIKDNAEIVEYLIHQGADIYALDNDDKSAWMLAPKTKFDIRGGSLIIQEEGAQHILSKYDGSPWSLNNPHHMQKMSDDLTQSIAKLSPEEMVRRLKKNSGFLQQIVTAGILVEAFQKLSYEQTKEYYKETHKEMPKEIKSQIEDVLRAKRALRKETCAD